MFLDETGKNLNLGKTNFIGLYAYGKDFFILFYFILFCVCVCGGELWSFLINASNLGIEWSREREPIGGDHIRLKPPLEYNN